MSLRIFNLRIRIPILMLFALDGGVLLLAPALAARISNSRFQSKLASDSLAFDPGSTIFTMLGLTSLMAVGLYSTRQRCDAAGLAVRVAVAIAATVMFAALVSRFAPGIELTMGALLGAGAAACVGILALRLSANRLIDMNPFKRRVLVFGAGPQAAKLLGLRRRADSRGFEILAFVEVDGDGAAVPADRLIQRPPDLFLWARENDVDDVVLAVGDRRRSFPMEELLECRLAGIDVLELPKFFERETGKVRLDVMTPSWIVLADGFTNSQLQQVLKRVFDLIVSAALLVPSIPLMLLTAAAIRIEDGRGAPILYRQRRIGLFNQPFEILKFRSMREDAEAEGPTWAVPDDPRVTRVGAFIRLTRIDELPQLINVLRGDMSFVGPRPERPEFVEALARAMPFYRARHAVKPGITGWAQICYPYGSSEKDALEKLQYDLYYIKNRGLLMDLSILIQTVEVIVWQKGAR